MKPLAKINMAFIVFVIGIIILGYLIRAKDETIDLRDDLIKSDSVIVWQQEKLKLSTLILFKLDSIADLSTTTMRIKK